MSYDSWLTNYDGYLESRPYVEYEVEYDFDNGVYFILEDGVKYNNERFKTASDAESFIKFLKGE